MEDMPQQVAMCNTAPRQFTPLEALKVSRDSMKQKLGEIEEAIQALEENPQVERVLTLLAKANSGRIGRDY